MTEDQGGPMGGALQWGRLDPRRLLQRSSTNDCLKIVRNVCYHSSRGSGSRPYRSMLLLKSVGKTCLFPASMIASYPWHILDALYLLLHPCRHMTTSVSLCIFTWHFLLEGQQSHGIKSQHYSRRPTFNILHLKLPSKSRVWKQWLKLQCVV